jgi:hypothetical protein
MPTLRRFAPTAPAESLWIRWPDTAGITGRMSLESVAESRGMRTLMLECEYDRQQQTHTKRDQCFEIHSFLYLTAKSTVSS